MAALRGILKQGWGLLPWLQKGRWEEDGAGLGCITAPARSWAWHPLGKLP